MYYLYYTINIILTLMYYTNNSIEYICTLLILTNDIRVIYIVKINYNWTFIFIYHII